MQSYQVRRVILIIIAVVALVLLVSFAASLFRRITSNNSVSTAITQPDIVLTDYEGQNSSVVLTYDGPVIAREEHRAIRITITPEKRTLEVLGGYNGSALVIKDYPNTASAYSVFLRAIDYEGFTLDQTGRYGEDERGICPQRPRTIVELFNNSSRLMRLWSSACDRKFGTLKGDSQDLFNLFKKQIPDYRELTKDVRM